MSSSPSPSSKAPSRASSTAPSTASPAMSAPDEFEQIARLFRPLTRGAPEALDLKDDAAVLPQRPGYDLVVTKDAIVEGVHFLPDDPPELVARKLLRVNLSDLAAKGAEPFGYFLAVGWPKTFDAAARTAFAEGLRADGERFDISLLGGDTVSTTGPWFASLTALGWVPTGRMVRRGGARPGDVVLVSGQIGEGWLGLKAARGEIADPDGALAARYRTPEPRLALREALIAHATAACDVSDGLIADVGHIAEASGVSVGIDLEHVPISPAGEAWLAKQPDEQAARIALAISGDDYEIVCTCAPGAEAGFKAVAAERRVVLTPIGRVREGKGVSATFNGQPVDVGRGGFQHR
ncbi:MAG: thiamine-phosphate kinase [Caulobacteraceae bacterium]|nr:thiamine-phosphate kinase [Caulobacteraceae bacterium]